MTNKQKQEAYLDQARDEWVQDQWAKREELKEFKKRDLKYRAKVGDAIYKSLNIK